MSTNTFNQGSSYSDSDLRTRPYSEKVIDTMVRAINGKVRYTVGNTKLPINRDGKAFYVNPEGSARYFH